MPARSLCAASSTNSRPGSQRQGDGLAEPGAGAAVVLLHDDDVEAPRHPHEVLRRDTGERHVGHQAAQVVAAGALAEPELLGAHADPDVGEALGHVLRVDEDLLAVHVGA